MRVIYHIGTPGLSRGLARFNVKSTTQGNSQLLGILCTADGLPRPCLDVILYSSLSALGGVLGSVCAGQTLYP